MIMAKDIFESESEFVFTGGVLVSGGGVGGEGAGLAAECVTNCVMGLF